MSKKHICFWEIDFPVKNWEKPLWKCMICGKKRRKPIPIFDISKLDNENSIIENVKKD